MLFLKVLKNLAYYIIDEEIISNLYKASVITLNEFVHNSKSFLTSNVTIALEIYHALS